MRRVHVYRSPYRARSCVLSVDLLSRCGGLGVRVRGGTNWPRPRSGLIARQLDLMNRSAVGNRRVDHLLLRAAERPSAFAGNLEFHHAAPLSSAPPRFVRKSGTWPPGS